MARSPLPFSLTMRARPTVPPAPARLKTSVVGDVVVLHHLGGGTGGGVVAAAGGVGDHDPQVGDRAGGGGAAGGPGVGAGDAAAGAASVTPAATAARRRMWFDALWFPSHAVADVHHARCRHPGAILVFAKKVLVIVVTVTTAPVPDLGRVHADATWRIGRLAPGPAWHGKDRWCPGNPRPAVRPHRAMTLAGQFLLLQLLSCWPSWRECAISLAQAARPSSAEVRRTHSAEKPRRPPGAGPADRGRAPPVRRFPRSRSRCARSPAPATRCWPTPRAPCWSPRILVARRTFPLGEPGPAGPGLDRGHQHGGTTVVVAQSRYWPRRQGRRLRLDRAEVPSVWSGCWRRPPTCSSTWGGVALGRGSLLLSRRVKRQTLGMEPAEIAGLVEHREALVHGVKEGVVALDRATG